MARVKSSTRRTRGERVRSHPVLIHIAATEEQREQWGEHAKASEMTLTEWVRRVLDAAGAVTVREVVEVRRRS